MKGVPLRIEVGPRDVASKQITIVRRDTGKKLQIPENDIIVETKNTLESIQIALYDRAKKKFEELTTVAESYNQLKEIVERKGGFIRADWCGDADCEAKIKAETGATIRAILFDQQQHGDRCVRCGKKAENQAYFARSY